MVELARDTDGGVMTILGHEPMVKLRLVFVLDRPYKITEWLARGFSQEDARGRLWTAALETFAREFGLEYDTACKDVSRAYYGASCKPGMAAKAFTKRFEGKAVRLDAIVPGTQKLSTRSYRRRARRSPRRSQDRARQGRNPKRRGRKSLVRGFKLEAWAAQYATAFNIEELFKAHDLVLEPVRQVDTLSSVSRSRRIGRPTLLGPMW